MYLLRKMIQIIKGDILDIRDVEPMTEVEDGFEMDAENAVRINLFKAVCTLTDSKVGGMPYLPEDFKYPLDEREEYKGNPLAFLAQINFEQLPPLPGFPQYGMLQFFVGTDYMYGLDIENPTSQASFRIIYHNEIKETDKLLTTLPVTIEYGSDFPVHQELKMGFTPEVSVMGWQDFRYETDLLKAYKKQFPVTGSYDDIPVEIRDKMEQLCNAGGSRVGGYPLFTQSDPRNSEEYADYTILLFQLDSDSDLGINWGDDGVCNFFITPLQLKERNFTNVLYHWDCY